ncbi:2,3-dihydro-2,3-dihydroxybenzoate dehydrogenase [Actinokineospora sp. NBRC 105648]|uniref:2,3-dihydro-2,3-dihydroxybenzoate dehydrogenase n=1 Tax=Actinokineospora sp. NBRC 105648 TaxID=3032206 RepID=UPI0024A5D5B8|nr:2,3-dihydro-2,3-dihydroxybenzoate dehydrogenase [Actinokineospora sp. NBRC 105648]GLZ36597.1 2,3-dihydro-2,3-dihydroxybenzoate dehydrogenase [Actinokineospora sp. NBRC 105648]
MTGVTAGTDKSDGIALVTGAAGGIGAAVVRALCERGAFVAAVDRDAEGLAEMADKARADGARVAAFAADITDRAAVEALVDEVEREIGPIDHLVNAAGVLRLGAARSLTDQDWADTFAVNTTGVFTMSSTVVDRMVARRAGAIVTITSNAAGTARVGMAAYAASKAAASMYTKCLGLEVAQFGVRCNLVAPGSTETAMLTSMWRDESGRAATVDGDPTAFKVGIPLGRVADPADIADAVAFLLSPRARHITMHDLTVDGGATLGV